jgi:hypothetical protein
MRPPGEVRNWCITLLMCAIPCSVIAGHPGGLSLDPHNSSQSAPASAVSALPPHHSYWLCHYTNGRHLPAASSDVQVTAYNFYGFCCWCCRTVPSDIIPTHMPSTTAPSINDVGEMVFFSISMWCFHSSCRAMLVCIQYIFNCLARLCLPTTCPLMEIINCPCFTHSLLQTSQREKTCVLGWRLDRRIIESHMSGWAPYPSHFTCICSYIRWHYILLYVSRNHQCKSSSLVKQMYVWIIAAAAGSRKPRYLSLKLWLIESGRHFCSFLSFLAPPWLAPFLSPPSWACDVWQLPMVLNCRRWVNPTSWLILS